MKIIKINYFALTATLLFGLHILSYGEAININNEIIPKKITENALELRKKTLKDNLSVEIVESITTEVGPRRM